MSEQPNERAREQARSQLSSIKEMVAALNQAEESGDEDAREDAIQAIYDDPLSIEVRDGWRELGYHTNEDGPAEFKILLCTGGPAVRIVGELDEMRQPRNPRLEYQDWFTQWEEFYLVEDEEKALLTYSNTFCFEE